MPIDFLAANARSGLQEIHFLTCFCAVISPPIRRHSLEIYTHDIQISKNNYIFQCLIRSLQKA
jgi:hypothetical protein